MLHIISSNKTSIAYRAPAKNHSILYDFTKWCAGQEEQHHIAWTGISMLTTTAVFFPLTMACILSNGSSFPLIITAMISLVMVFVLNLAAMPTQYTIPAFFLGILIDAAVIITTIFY